MLGITVATIAAWIVFLCLPCHSRVFPTPAFSLQTPHLAVRATARDNQKDFEPYADNGGTIVAIAGKDFVIIGADTRLAEQYFIRSRKWTRIFELSKDILLASAGCAADLEGLKFELARTVGYVKLQRRADLGIGEVAGLLSTELYRRHSLPYLSYTLLVGLDTDGHGVVVQSDVLGSYEELLVSSCGRGQPMIDPILDEVRSKFIVDDSSGSDLWRFDDVSGKYVSDQRPYLNISKNEAYSVIKQCFVTASQREISLGDGVDVFLLEKVEGEVKTHRSSFRLPST